MIKLPRLAENQLYQIKSMNSDNSIADLQVNSQKNHQSYSVNQKKVKKLTSLTEVFQIISSQMDGNWLSTRLTIRYLVDSIQQKR